MTTTIAAPVPQVLRTNLAHNPHVASLTGWGYDDAGATISVTVEAGTDTPDGRAGFLRGTVDTASDTSDGQGPTYSQALAGVSGSAVTFSLSARLSSVTPAFYALAVTTYLDDVEVETVWETYEFLVADTWTPASVTLTPTGDFDRFVLHLREESAASPVAGSTVDVTTLMIEQGSAPTPYFDGGTAATGALIYAWTGAAGGSTSTESASTTEVSPDVVLDYGYQREARTIVHSVLDRSDPDVTLRPVGLRAGTLNMLCADRATATAVEDLHLSPAVLTLTNDGEPTADMTYVATGQVGVTWDATYDKWTVTVGYQEVLP